MYFAESSFALSFPIKSRSFPQLTLHFYFGLLSFSKYVIQEELRKLEEENRKLEEKNRAIREATKKIDEKTNALKKHTKKS